MNDLANFLNARLDIEEAIAKTATPGPCHGRYEEYDEQCADAAHIALHSPVRALREAEAKRARLALALKAAAGIDRLRHADTPASVAEMAVAVACATIAITAVKHDAAIWSDHPDYQEEWKP